MDIKKLKDFEWRVVYSNDLGCETLINTIGYPASKIELLENGNVIVNDIKLDNLDQKIKDYVSQFVSKAVNEFREVEKKDAHDIFYNLLKG